MRIMRTYSLDPRTVELLSILAEDTNEKICRVIDMLVVEKALHCQDHKLLSHEKIGRTLQKSNADYRGVKLTKKKSNKSS